MSFQGLVAHFFLLLNNAPLSRGNAVCPPTYWWASWLLTVRAVRTTAAVHICAQVFVWAYVFSSFGGTRKSVIAGSEIGYWPGDLPLSPQGPFWQWPPFCDNPTPLPLPGASCSSLETFSKPIWTQRSWLCPQERVFKMFKSKQSTVMVGVLPSLHYDSISNFLF